MPTVTERRPKKSPFPYDLVVSGYDSVSGALSSTARLMLGRDKPGGDGPLVGMTQSDTPEQQVSWTDWSGGFGHKYEQEGEHDRYYYALGIDASIGGMLMLGPLVTQFTPATTDSTNGITKFFEMTGSLGAATLFCLAGRYVLYRVSDGTWSVSKDLGAGNVATDVVTWQQNTGGSTNYALVAIGDGAADYIWYYDAASVTTTWTQHASLQALAFATVGRELYRGHDVNYAAKVDTDSDPLTAANWGADKQFRIGDRLHPITGMSPNAAGQLVIFKESSIHALLPDGSDQQLYGGVGFTPNAEHGKVGRFYLWENDLYVTYNDSHFRLGPALELDPIGPERMPENDSRVRGYITSGVGTPYTAYCGLYSRDNTESYLMKLGAWRVGPDGITHREDIWHGSLTAAFTNKKITAMHMSTIGAATNHRRVYIGFSDGSLAWFTLPCTVNPDGCDNYDFIESTDADASVLQFPQTDLGAAHQPKHLHGITVVGQNLKSTGSNRKAVIGLDTNDLNGVFFATGTGDFDTTPGERQDFTTDTTRTQMRMQIGLRQTSSANIGETPVVRGVTLDYSVRNQVQRMWEFLVLAEDGVPNRLGQRSPYSSSEIRTVLRAMRATKGSCSVKLPDESTAEMTFVSYEETQAWDPRTECFRAAVKMTAVETAKGSVSL